MAPPQEYKVLPVGTELTDICTKEDNRRVPPMAPRQGSSSAQERDGWRGQGMAPPQVCEEMIDRPSLFDSKNEGSAAPVKEGKPMPDDEMAWKNLKEVVLHRDDDTAATEPMSDDEEEEENWSWMQGICAGLDPPTLWSGERVSGKNKAQHRRENKRVRIARQEAQPSASYWSRHRGDFTVPPPAGENKSTWKGDMCPQNLALHHPAAAKLLEYATGGCPCNTGKPWTKEQMWAAVERGPHKSALEEDAIAQLEGEIADKVKAKQCKVVLWDDIKDNPPEQLKISPLAMIPHKSRKYRAILDLSFRIKLKNGKEVPSVNEGTTLEAPAGAIDQLGHSLQRIIISNYLY